METQSDIRQPLDKQRQPRERGRRNRGPRVSTWTTFHVSSEFSLHAVELSERPQFSFLKYLFSSPGHMLSRWGRLSPSQDLVLLISVWIASDYENFLRSEANEKYQGGIKALNNDVEAVVLRASHQRIQIVNTLRCVDGVPITIRKAHFPLTLSAERKAAVTSLKGLDDHGNFAAGLGDPFFKDTPWDLWFVWEAELIFQCCYFWKDEQQRQEGFDCRYGLVEQKADHSVLVGSERLLDRWDRQLKELGAVVIEDEKVELQKLLAFEPKEVDPWLDEHGDIICTNKTAIECLKNANPHCFMKRRCKF